MLSLGDRVNLRNIFPPCTTFRNFLYSLNNPSAGSEGWGWNLLWDKIEAGVTDRAINQNSFCGGQIEM